jgi:hypothetical protein
MCDRQSALYLTWHNAEVTLIICALVVTSCTSCSLFGLGNRRIAGSGTMATETRPVSGVTAVELQFHGDLFIDLGDEEKLVISSMSRIPRRKAES